MRIRVSLFLIAIASLPALHADDWPQFRGPQRDGVSREKGLMQEWPAGGPKLRWTFDGAGLGYSGPAIVGDRLYLCGARGDEDFVFALDLKGDEPKELWARKIGPRFTWKGNQWNTGPNVSPTVEGGRVYALGGFGDLVCVDATDGQEQWRVNLPRDLGGEVNPIGGGAEEPTPLGWGYSHAPLVDGDRLICVPGGSKGLLAALDKKTGKLLWQSKDVAEQASYSSPMIAEIGGVRQIIQVTNSGIVGITIEDGRTLWLYRRDPAYDDVVIATPIVHKDHVFSTVGFQQGCDLIKLVTDGKKFDVEKVFSDRSVQNRDGGVILVGDHLYGHSENLGWFCREFITGKVAWSERNKLARGPVTCADGRLYCLAEKGEVVMLVEPSPDGWREKGKMKLPRESQRRLPSGGVWTHPVIANGRLYVRDQELLFCYEVRK